MEESWYQVKKNESRYELGAMANDGLLGIKIVEARQMTGNAIKFSDTSLEKLLQRGQNLIRYMIAGVEFLRGSKRTKNLDPELILMLNIIRHEEYLSYDEIEKKCKLALQTFDLVEKGQIDLKKLNDAESLLNTVSNITKSELKVPL